MPYTTTAYCSLSQIVELLPKAVIPTETTVPSVTQVSNYAASCAASINAALSAGGVSSLPVTTPAYFVDDLTRLNALGAAAQAMMAALPASTGPGSAQLGRDYWKDFQERLAQFRDGEGIPDEVGRDGGGEVHSYWTDTNAIGNDDAVDAYGETVDANPVFKMGDDW